MPAPTEPAPIEPALIEQGDPASVAVLLVSHDGAAWLPSVLEGVAAQTAPIESLVAIDTGSRDGSADLVENACAAAGLPATVVRAPIGTTYPEAVEMGLARLREAPRPPTWVWLLHDDSRPDPAALRALTAVAAERPHADFLGPKLREWPSLRRLLELGVTISGTGRRETGLERGEYDQGQHPEVREVLAVNSAGMLARRETLEAVGGFDHHLPMFGNDLDLGWRSAAAGHTTLIVPDAVVFHAEAAHRGVRRTALTGRHTHFQERRAALYTLLANVRPFALPFQLIRIVLGSLLRMLGFLVVRSVGEALDELAALVAVATRPGMVHAARRERARVVAANRGDAGPDTERVRRLLAPWWLPYRHGLDFVGDLVAAATNQAADVAERRRAAAAEQSLQQPSARRPTEDEEEFEDSGFVVRFFTNPVAVVLAVAVLALIVGARDAFGDISGGALSPAPSGRGTWWSLHLESWHALGFGTAVPAPGYVLLLAALGSLFGPGWTMSFLLITAGPLAVWGAWRFLRLVGRLLTPAGAPRWVIAGGAVAYAAVPLAAGAWGSGRWGVIVAAALLPWMAHAALGFADPEPARRWRAAWRAGLVLAVLTALAPVLWWLFLALAVVVLVAAAVLVRATIGERSVWGPPVAALAVPPVVLAPWWLPALWTGAGSALFLDIGRWPTPATGGWSLLAGRFGESGAPLWIGLILPVLALLALLPRASRIGVLVCWLVAAVTAVVAIPLAITSIDLPGLATQQPGLGAVLLLLHGSWVSAVVLGAAGLRGVELDRWRRGAVALVAAVAVVVPVGGVAWFVVDGGEQLTERPATGVPVYMQQRAESADQDGILVLRGSVAEGVDYEVVRGDGPTVGEDEITGLTEEDPEVTEEITALITAPSTETVEALNRRGVLYVVLPAPADGEIAARLDASGGLDRASTSDRDTQAWEMAQDPPADSVEGPRSWLRILLLVVQFVAIAVLIVWALPQVRRSRG
ncbi:glycosyltransferase family 2 protein [Nocardioides sp. BGMRC 2183]|nr:glycosyltransferase family 2 protein [Nocardioides sp. BGMRC 2183]